MQIFISHPIKDENLAIKLQEILKTSPLIEKAYIATKTPEFELEISQKIINEINKSDYVVAIVTVNTQDSASVHQEIGFAQGIGKPRIPMIEKEAKKGFLHEGKDYIGFERDNFEFACNEVLQQILKRGPTKRKFTDEESKLIQKSAHYRYTVHAIIIEIFESMFVRLNMGNMSQRYKLFSTKNSCWKKNAVNHVKIFLSRDSNKLVLHFSTIEFEKFHKLDSEYNGLVNQLEHAKRFPHDEMCQEESDLLIKLEEYIRTLPGENFDLIEWIKIHYNLNPHRSDNCSEILKSENSKYQPLRRQIEFVISDLNELVDILRKLQDLYIGYKEKFGDIAFKH